MTVTTTVGPLAALQGGGDHIYAVIVIIAVLLIAGLVALDWWFKR